MPPAPGCPRTGPPSPEVTGAICRVPSTSFSQAPWYALPVHLCRFRVRSIMWGLFPGSPWLPSQSDKQRQRSAFVTTHGPRTIDLVPIAYAFRPRLRGRLTLRGLALRRNPWTFGERGSHPLCRYSCQHSHFRYLQRSLRNTFIGLRNAPLPVQKSEDRCQNKTRRGVNGACRLPSAFNPRLRQALQHLRDFMILVAPPPPYRLVDISQIPAIAQPHPHLIG